MTKVSLMHKSFHFSCNKQMGFGVCFNDFNWRMLVEDIINSEINEASLSSTLSKCHDISATSCVQMTWGHRSSGCVLKVSMF